MAFFSFALATAVVVLYCVTLFLRQANKWRTAATPRVAKATLAATGLFPSRGSTSLPGPLGLPLVGNLLQVLGSKPFVTFSGWAAQYGDVYGLRLGRQRAVVLNSVEAAREAYVSKGKSFSGRPAFHTMSVLHGGEKKFVFALHSDALLKTYRKTVLSDMRKRMDALGPLVEKEVDKMLEHVFADGEYTATLDMRNIVHKMAANLAHGYAFGRSFSLDDPALASWIKALAEYRELLHWFRHENFLPQLQLIMGDFNAKVASFRATSQPLYAANLQEARERRDTASDDGCDNGLLDTMLDMIEGSDAAAEGDLNDNDIVSVLRDVMFGASDGTFQPLTWLLLYLTQESGLHEKLNAEIMSVIGSERMPTLADRDKMPFVEATIREVLRHSEITSLGIPRRTEDDVTIQGHVIPKDTLVIANVFAIHRDARHWKEPLAFNPERFLDQQGELRNASELSYMPFSTGHRSCVGQNVARSLIFLLFTRFLQKVAITAAEDVTTEGINAGGSFNPELKPFKVTLERQSW